MTNPIVIVEKLSHEGRGIAHVEGRVVFIDGVLPGEEVQIEYLRRKSNFAEAKALAVMKPSPDRIAPKCAAFGICGGCSFQHWPEALQIAHKQQVLAEHFKHFGGLEPLAWLPPLQAKTFGYRHKARLGVKWVVRKNSALVGFREKSGHFLSDIHQCEVLHPAFGEKIDALRAWVSGLSIRDQIPQLEVAVADEGPAMIIRHLKPLSEADLVATEQFAHEHGYRIYLQPKGPESIHLFYPKGADPLLHYQLRAHRVVFAFGPTDFTQVNASLNEKMMDQALQLLDLRSQDRVLDLFCGIGNFTLPMARYAAQVVGVEGDSAMTARAAQNAQANELNNVEFYKADLFQDPTAEPFWKQPYDKILLDPPRAGAEVLCAKLGSLKASRIVYVSCNPATLARDAGLICQNGYRLVQAGVMDMFPHTTHVESIAVFERV